MLTINEGKTSVFITFVVLVTSVKSKWLYFSLCHQGYCWGFMPPLWIFYSQIWQPSFLHIQMFYEEKEKLIVEGVRDKETSADLLHHLWNVPPVGGREARACAGLCAWWCECLHGCGTTKPSWLYFMCHNLLYQALSFFLTSYIRNDKKEESKASVLEELPDAASMSSIATSLHKLYFSSF